MSNKISTTEILTGNSLHILKTLPDESVNCVITSPPYYGLRDYGTGTTAVACIKYGDDYIGSEISSNQCKFAEDRIHKFIDYQNYINAKLSLF